MDFAGSVGMEARPEESNVPGPLRMEVEGAGGQRALGDTSPPSPVSWQHVPTPGSGSTEEAPDVHMWPPKAPQGAARALEPPPLAPVPWPAKRYKLASGGSNSSGGEQAGSGPESDRSDKEYFRRRSMLEENAEKQKRGAEELVRAEQRVMEAQQRATEESIYAHEEAAI